jgi:hypothetical protein
MGRAKDIRLKVITAQVSNAFVRKYHYSGKVVPNSNLHFGAYLDKHLHGVMAFGPSINKKGTINLVRGTGWHEFIELNRMAFDRYLPRNSESRCIAIALKLIRKHAPQVRWVISFADATQCGDGAIYRAAGFKLVGIAENSALRINPATGKPMHAIQAFHLKKQREFRNWVPLKGYQLKYVYLIDPTCELAVPEIPYSKIDELGIGMYLGEKKHAVLAQGSAPGNQPGGGVRNDHTAQNKIQ